MIISLDELKASFLTMMENIAQMSGLQANENMLNLSRQDIMIYTSYGVGNY